MMDKPTVTIDFDGAQLVMLCKVVSEKIAYMPRDNMRDRWERDKLEEVMQKLEKKYALLTKLEKANDKPVHEKTE